MYSLEAKCEEIGHTFRGCIAFIPAIGETSGCDGDGRMDDIVDGHPKADITLGLQYMSRVGEEIYEVLQ